MRENEDFWTSCGATGLGLWVWEMCNRGVSGRGLGACAARVRGGRGFQGRLLSLALWDEGGGLSFWVPGE